MLNTSITVNFGVRNRKEIVPLSDLDPSSKSLSEFSVKMAPSFSEPIQATSFSSSVVLISALAHFALENDDSLLEFLGYYVCTVPLQRLVKNLVFSKLPKIKFKVNCLPNLLTNF
jgi:hypothetical protein